MARQLRPGAKEEPALGVKAPLTIWYLQEHMTGSVEVQSLCSAVQVL